MVAFYGAFSFGPASKSFQATQKAAAHSVLAKKDQIEQLEKAQCHEMLA
jgi:hypothetical protein